jgi:hypothetical protein
MGAQRELRSTQRVFWVTPTDLRVTRKVLWATQRLLRGAPKNLSGAGKVFATCHWQLACQCRGCARAHKNRRAPHVAAALADKAASGTSRRGRLPVPPAYILIRAGTTFAAASLLSKVVATGCAFIRLQPVPHVARSSDLSKDKHNPQACDDTDRASGSGKSKKFAPYPRRFFAPCSNYHGRCRSREKSAGKPSEHQWSQDASSHSSSTTDKEPNRRLAPSASHTVQVCGPRQG